MTPLLVEVFLVQVKPICTSEVALLSPAERLRLFELRSEAARNEFVSLRACLRLILAERLGGSPQSVAILAKPGYPPVVRDGGWYFSLSHSRTYGVVALARGGPIGVDIEADHQVQDAMAIARAVLHPSECDWVSGHSVDTRSGAFLQLWVRKEAVVKASGQGLVVGLDSWPVLTVPDQAGSSVDVELQGRVWRVRDVAGLSGHFMALATPCLDVDVRLREAPSGWSPGLT